MGLVAGKIRRRFRRPKRYKIILIGLDGAGKKTILDKLQIGKIDITPIVGVNVRTLKFKNILIVSWDLGGTINLRFFWKNYFRNSSAIVYVVDSSDAVRLEMAKEKLEAVLQHEEVTGIPLLVMANKQDLPEAMSASQIMQSLGLARYGRPWHLLPTSGTTSDGLYESFHYLFLMITLLKTYT